eukprot:TRINITY_DN56151_c0_g1_i1.p1 TRINITY_DN56151_c0_g1~~TRINITY_DN56151_c0_g1_i1.p1  ORF type:complete len:360 (+),score=59.22 TRINITY_DN56151_c0_g1_i1:93-1082(+)
MAPGGSQTRPGSVLVSTSVDSVSVSGEGQGGFSPRGGGSCAGDAFSFGGRGSSVTESSIARSVRKPAPPGPTKRPRMLPRRNVRQLNLLRQEKSRDMQMVATFIDEEVDSPNALGDLPMMAAPGESLVDREHVECGISGAGAGRTRGSGGRAALGVLLAQEPRSNGGGDGGCSAGEACIIPGLGQWPPSHALPRLATSVEGLPRQALSRRVPISRRCWCETLVDPWRTRAHVAGCWRSPRATSVAVAAAAGLEAAESLKQQRRIMEALCRYNYDGTPQVRRAVLKDKAAAACRHGRRNASGNETKSEEGELAPVAADKEEMDGQSQRSR